MLTAVRFSVRPTHAGVFAPNAGAEGTARTVTLKVPGRLVHPPLLAVTEYMPVARLEAPVMAGFCEDDVKPLGPVQL
jgi:hypothetical protein